MARKEISRALRPPFAGHVKEIVMMTWQAGQVLGLGAAIGASALGASMCFVPAENPAKFWNSRTLQQVAKEVGLADKELGDALSREARLASPARRTEISREAWVRFTNLISGGGIAGTSPVSASFQSQFSLIDRLNGEVLADKKQRAAWLKKGLEEMGAPPPICQNILASMEEISGMKLQLERGTRSYFEAHLARRGPNITVDIETPQSQVIVTEKQLNLLCARAILLSDIKNDAESKIAPSRFVRAMRVFPRNLALPLYSSIEARCLGEIRKELRKKKELAGFAEFIEEQKHDPGADGPHILETLARKIGERYPCLGTKLLTLFAELECASSAYVKFIRWEWYIKAISSARPESLAAAPIVGMETLSGAIAILSPFDACRRRKWIAEGMKRIGAPDADAILDSKEIDLEAVRHICLRFDRAKDKYFTASAEISRGKDMMRVLIEAPAAREPVSLEEIQALIARAIAIEFAKGRLPLHAIKRHARAEKFAICAPIPVITMESGGNAVALGALPAAPGMSPFAHSQKKSFIEIMGWLQTGARAMRMPLRSGIDAELPWQIREGQDADIWRALIEIPLSTRVLFKYLSAMLNAEFSFVFETTDENGGNIEISLEKDGRTGIVSVRLPPDILRKINGRDLIDMLLRALHKKELKDYYDEYETHLKDARHWNLSFVMPLSKNPCVISLEDLRNGSDLNPDIKIARSCIDLLLMFKDSGASGSETMGITGRADGGVKRDLTAAIQAVAAASKISEESRTRWEGVLGIRRWQLKASDVKIGDGLIVDVLPAENTALLHIHGDASGAKPSDWLYLLSAAAANPGFALRVAIEKREVVVGGRGNPAPFYGSIAANRIFERFGVSDPKAKMPASIALPLPGGIPAERNPKFASAPPDARKKYVAALRWFALLTIPDEWRPTAADSCSEARHKYRLMAKKWHADVGPRLEEKILFQIATGHWTSILDIYE